MNDLRTIAAAYAEALKQNFVPVTAVLAWVDRQMEALAAPPIQLIDIYLDPSAQRVADLLDQVPGESDPERVFRLCLGFAREALARDQSRAEEIAYWLFLAWLDGLAPSPEAEQTMSGLEGDFDVLTYMGSTTGREDLVRELDAFLSEYGERPDPERPER